MSRRNGYTDFAIPLKLLRDALRKTMRENRTLSREALVAHGVEKILDGGLFKQYADEFKGYIVTNALSMAENDEKAAGFNPVTGTSLPASSSIPASRRPKRPLPLARVAAEKSEAVAAAKSRLADLAPILFMKLPTPYGKPLGECTRAEGLKLGGKFAIFFKLVPNGKTLSEATSEGKLRELWDRK